jgi:site-specific recombinase XerD
MEPLTALLPIPHDSLEKLADLTCAGFSDNTKRTYRAYLVKFLEWTRREARELSRDSVQAWLTEADPPPEAVFAVKRLAAEAADRQLIGPLDAYLIQSIRWKVKRGRHSGCWLTEEQAKQVLLLPDRKTLHGRRDAALLSLLLGCGLRREEAATVTWDRYQLREDRACLVDIIGKGNKVRTIPVVQWAADAIDAWRRDYENIYARVAECPETILVSFRAGLGSKTYRRLLDSLKGGETPSTFILEDVQVAPLSSDGVYFVLKSYARLAGIEFSPHDLRRSMATLMLKGRVDLTQIQATLGHSDISTTARYLESALELRKGLAGVDKLAGLVEEESDD